MPKAREALAQSDIDDAVKDERERCAWLCEELAGRWERSAAKLRVDGSYTTRALWPPFKEVKCIKPNWEKAADDVDAAVHGLRTVARGIREGWDSEERPRSRMAAAVLEDERAAIQHDEAVHGVRFFAGARRTSEPYSVSGVRTAIWPCSSHEQTIDERAAMGPYE